MESRSRNAYDTKLLSIYLAALGAANISLVGTFYGQGGPYPQGNRIKTLSKMNWPVHPESR